MNIISGILNRLRYVNKKVFSNSQIQKSAEGILYWIQPHSALDNQILKRGHIDDWDFLKKIIGYIPKDAIIFDIGANVGLLSLPLAKLVVPHGKVFAYEPDSENFNQLKKNIQINELENLIPLPLALQDNTHVTTLQFHIRRSIDGDGNLNRGLSSLKAISLHEKNVVSVQASTVDAQVQQLHLPRVDFMKIDVEGAETQVLMGAQKTITSFHPLIQYEYNNSLDKILNESNTIKTFMFLKEHGYRQFYIQNETAKITEMLSPDKKLADANVICFYGEILPEFLTD